MITLYIGFGLILAFSIGVSWYLIAQENQEIEALRAERVEIELGRRL
jgi:hypothetical protein